VRPSELVLRNDDQTRRSNQAKKKRNFENGSQKTDPTWLIMKSLETHWTTISMHIVTLHVVQWRNPTVNLLSIPREARNTGRIATQRNFALNLLNLHMYDVCVRKRSLESAAQRRKRTKEKKKKEKSLVRIRKK